MPTPTFSQQKISRSMLFTSPVSGFIVVADLCKCVKFLCLIKFVAINLSDITVLYLTVSEESSYSSDNTEPEDDCRGCQLQWHNRIRGEVFQLLNLIVRLQQAQTSPCVTQTSSRCRAPTLKSFREFKLFVRKDRTHWPLSKARPGLKVRWAGTNKCSRTLSSDPGGGKYSASASRDQSSVPVHEHVHKYQLLLKRPCSTLQSKELLIFVTIFRSHLHKLKA